MTQRILRPLTFGDLFDEAIDLYRNNFMLLAGIAGLVYIPLAGLMALIGGSLFQALGTLPGTSSAANPFLQSSFWGTFAVATIIGVILQIMSVAATTWAVSSCYLGSRPTILASYKAILSRMIPLVFAALLTYLMVGVGFMLCILPGIVALVLTVFVSQALILENKGVIESIKRSFVLARSNPGRILLVLVISILLMWVISLLIDIPLQLLALGVAEQTGLALAASSIMRSIVSSAVMPIITVALVLLYYDVRVRHEGFDIEMLAASLGTEEQAAKPEM